MPLYTNKSANQGGGSPLSDSAAAAIGTAAAGTSTSASRADHVHASGVADGNVVKASGGALAAANPALEYVSPAKTANTASATTVTLPETGLIVPITGTTQIDYITVPTGSVPRYVILWFQSGIVVRHEVAGAGAGAALVSMVPTGGTANLGISFAANSFLPLLFDGTVWRRANSGAHWDGTGVTGLTANTNAKCFLDGNTGSKLQWGSATSYLADGAACTITAPIAVFTARIKHTKAVVASATNVTLTAGASLIEFSGTTQINTLTATGWTDGARIAIRFASAACTLKHNSGGTNDWMLKAGLDYVSTAGAVLEFIFDGTDMVEVGRT